MPLPQMILSFMAGDMLIHVGIHAGIFLFKKLRKKKSLVQKFQDYRKRKRRERVINEYKERIIDRWYSIRYR